MPKISKPTIREHKESVRAALVGTAADIIEREGVAAVLPGTVTAGAGVARSTFYKYFATRDDVLVAVGVEAMEAWAAELGEAVDAQEEGLPRLRALVDATMRMTADGRHDLASALRDEQLSPTHREDLMALHDALFRPALTVLAGLDVPNPERASHLIQGVLGIGVQLVQHGVAPQEAADDVYRLITRGLLT
ncbi:TetR/AcrR family transcriptional regulator [Microbacterium gorillae]|uniref:TetR/AcrR family transcriptional regulator n=1 Tax=Microbacterium gorillae TaxID=1231063 RepID=UPI00058F96D9|nr:TetR/AcrR family transcriptional regulator [Microbacterium gorillae]